jgi:8-hydroxy-5-deazaflavin:NADPH oxidoreductase
MHRRGRAIPLALPPRDGDDMNITIIGTGNMARGIATRALEGGHGVTLLGTERAKAEALAAELPGEAQAGAVGDPLSGDVVVLAVWYQAVPDVLARYGDQLDGRVVVDITNPVDPESYAPLTVEAGSVAQEIAATVPGARVVKAFNTTFAGTLVEGTVAGTPLDVFVAGDDEAAKGVVAQLATDGGLRAIDVGPLALAHQLEGAGYLSMAVQPALGTNYGSALKVVA